MANLARDRYTYRKNINRLRKGISESKAKLKTTDLSSSLRSLIMTAFETMAKLDVNEKEEANRPGQEDVACFTQELFQHAAF